MSFGTRWPQKPPVGTRLDFENPLCNGLQWFYALNENTGGVINDGIGRLPLIPTGFGAANPWGATSGGVGLNCDATGYGAQATLPTALQLQPPITLAFGFRKLGTPTANSGICGLLINNTATSPYGFEVYWGSSTSFYLGAGDGVTFNTDNAFYTPTTGVDAVFAVSSTSAAQSMYVNGLLLTTATLGYLPTYTATSLFYLGNFVPISQNSNTLFYWAAVWNRILSAAEHALLGSNVNAIWQIFTPVLDVRRAFVAPPVSFPAGYFQNQTSLQTTIRM
jgi:hypothetical protein